MSRRSVQRKFKVVQLQHPTNHTTATDGQNTAVDTLGFTEALLLVPVGVMSNVNLNIDIQHSDEAAANFATVSAPVLNTINPRLLKMTNADANTCIVGYLDLKGLKRYLKPVDTLNANSALYGMSVILLGPDDSEKTKSSVQAYEPDGA